MATKSKAKKTTTGTVFKSKGSDPDYESYRFYKWFGNQCKFRLQEETDESFKKALNDMKKACDIALTKITIRLAHEQEAKELETMKEWVGNVAQEHPEWATKELRDYKGRLIGIGFFIRLPGEEPEFCESLYS